LHKALQHIKHRRVQIRSAPLRRRDLSVGLVQPKLSLLVLCREVLLLWISGHPGSGKTVLSAYLMEHLSANKPPFISRNTVCFFFCDDKIESQRDGKAILRSLIHQILTRRRKLIRHIKAAYDVQGPRLVDNFNELWRIFKAITTDSGAGSINIIADAIDECKEKTRRRFLEGMAAFVGELQSTTRPTHSVKILITSRPLLNRQYRMSNVQIHNLLLGPERAIEGF